MFSPETRTPFRADGVFLDGNLSAAMLITAKLSTHLVFRGSVSASPDQRTGLGSALALSGTWADNLLLRAASARLSSSGSRDGGADVAFSEIH
jgi:hypothetical protein